MGRYRTGYAVMSIDIEDAKRTLHGMGRTVRHNLPGPEHLAQGFRETVMPVLPVWIVIAFLLLFGEPLVKWLCQ